MEVTESHGGAAVTNNPAASLPEEVTELIGENVAPPPPPALPKEEPESNGAAANNPVASLPKEVTELSGDSIAPPPSLPKEEPESNGAATKNSAASLPSKELNELIGDSVAPPPPPSLPLPKEANGAATNNLVASLPKEVTELSGENVAPPPSPLPALPKEEPESNGSSSTNPSVASKEVIANGAPINPFSKRTQQKPKQCYAAYMRRAADRHGVTGCTVDYKGLSCVIYEACFKEDIPLEISQWMSPADHHAVKRAAFARSVASPAGEADTSFTALSIGESGSPIIQSRFGRRRQNSTNDSMCVSENSSFKVPEMSRSDGIMAISPFSTVQPPKDFFCEAAESVVSSDGDLEGEGENMLPALEKITEDAALFAPSPLGCTPALCGPRPSEFKTTATPSFKYLVEPASFSENPIAVEGKVDPGDKMDKSVPKLSKRQRARDAIPELENSVADSIGSYAVNDDSMNTASFEDEFGPGHSPGSLGVMQWKCARAFEEQLRSEMTFVDDICINKSSLVAKRVSRVLKSGRQVASYYSGLLEQREKEQASSPNVSPLLGPSPDPPEEDKGAKQVQTAQLLGYRTTQHVSILIQQLRFAHEDAAFLLWFMTLNCIAVGKLVRKYRRSLPSEAPEDFQPLQVINSSERTEPAPRKADSSHWYFMKMGPEQMLETMSRVEKLYSVIAELAPGLAPNIYHRANDDSVCGDMDFLLQTYRHYLPRWSLPQNCSPLQTSRVPLWQNGEEGAKRAAGGGRRLGIIPAAAASAAAAATRKHFRNKHKQCNRLTTRGDAPPTEPTVQQGARSRMRKPGRTAVFYSYNAKPKTKREEQAPMPQPQQTQPVQPQSGAKLFHPGEQILDCYEIGDVVGEGTYGIVVQAWSVTSGDPVAIKTITCAWSHPVLGQRAYREVQILQQIAHPHITPIIDVFVSEGSSKAVYIVMPFFPHTCENLLIDRQLSPLHKKGFALELLSALAYLHSRGVVHRDVKLSNILVDDTPSAYLSDFGLSRTLSSGEKAAPAGAVADMRDHPDYIQTQWYRAPEVLLCSKTVEEGADMWSMGCILAEMMTGVPLFPGQDDMHQLELILSSCSSEKGSLTDLLEEKLSENTHSVTVKLSKKKTLSEAVGECWVTGSSGRDSKVEADEYCEVAPTDLALDLIKKLLQFNPESRIFARRAMHHKWFLEEPSLPLSSIEVAINDAARFEGEDHVVLDLPCDELHNTDAYRSAVADKAATSYRRKIQSLKVDRSKAAVTIQRFWRWKTGRLVLASSFSITDRDVSNLVFANYSKNPIDLNAQPRMGDREFQLRTIQRDGGNDTASSAVKEPKVVLSHLYPRASSRPLSGGRLLPGGRSPAPPSPYLSPLRGGVQQQSAGKKTVPRRRSVGRPPRHPQHCPADGGNNWESYCGAGCVLA